MAGEIRGGGVLGGGCSSNISYSQLRAAAEPRTEMASSLDSLNTEINILREHIGALEIKLVPVSRPISQVPKAGGVSGNSPLALLIEELQAARNQVMSLTERVINMRDNLVV